MNYSKIILLFIFLMIIPFASGAHEEENVAVVYSSTPQLQVVATKYEPYPAEPGEYLEIWFKIQNIGEKDVQNASFGLEPEFPFSLEPGEEAVRNYGKLLAGQQVLARFKLIVDADAVEGNNALEYKFSKDGKDWIIAQTTVYIQTIDATLAIIDVSSVPEKTAPGKTTKLTITLKNLADSLMKDVSLKLNLSSAEMPFAPVGSSTEKKIKKINPDEEIDVEFSLISTADAAIGIYKIPIELTYYDELEESYSKKDLISLMIGVEPDLTIEIDESELYKTKLNGKVSLKIINKGLGDAKFLTIKLAESADYGIYSQKTLYIGDVDSDDYETAEFRLEINDLNKDEVILPVALEYKDENNIEYAESFDVVLPLYSAEKLGIKTRNPFVIWVLAVIIIIAIYFFYRKWLRARIKK